MRVDKHQLYLHSFGKYAFYVDGGGISDLKFVAIQLAARLGKTGKIGRQLKKYTVVFNASHSTGYRLSYGKERGVFRPSSEQLFMSKI